MSEDEVERLDIYPAWRKAAVGFLEARYQPGHTLEFEWLFNAFGIEMPAETTPLGVAEKSKLQFLQSFKAFEEHLLFEHQIALANVRGVGYRVMAPGLQSSWAEKVGLNEIRRAVRKLHDRLSNVDANKLTSAERKESADALARWAMLSGMSERVRDQERQQRARLTKEADAP